MSDEFSYVWLLPLLEKPFEVAALDLPDAASTLRKKYTLPTEIALQPLVVTALTLTSHSEYWAGLTLRWLERWLLPMYWKVPSNFITRILLGKGGDSLQRADWIQILSSKGQIYRRQ